MSRTEHSSRRHEIDRLQEAERDRARLDAERGQAAAERVQRFQAALARYSEPGRDEAQQQAGQDNSGAQEAQSSPAAGAGSHDAGSSAKAGKQLRQGETHSARNHRTEMRESGARTAATGANAGAVSGVRRQQKDQRDGRDSDGGSRQDMFTPAALAALQAGQPALAQSTAMPIAAPQAMRVDAQALGELIERHVRQLAVSEGGAGRGGRGEVMLRLDDSLLPDTVLLLSQSDDGRWKLRADTRSPHSYATIRRAADGLQARFSARNLGELDIESTFND